MSKRKQSTWDNGLMEFSAGSDSGDWPVDLYPEDKEVIEDAHEALSKLYNKTNKRTKQIRGIRPKDAWH